MTIYKMTIGDDSYIGSTTNYGSRKSSHRYKIKNGIHAPKVLKAYEKINNIDEVIFTVLEDNVAFNDLRESERLYISLLRPSLNDHGVFDLIKESKLLDHPRYDEVAKLSQEGVPANRIAKMCKVSKETASRIKRHYSYYLDVEKYIVHSIIQASNNITLAVPNS